MNTESQAPENHTCPECGYQYQPGLSGDLTAGCPKCLVNFLDDEGTTNPDAGYGGEILKVGDHLADMEILELFGRGGMGVVYKARQNKLDRIVALKVLDARLAKNEEFAHRFRREAKALAALNHPNIVHVYDSGQEGERFYLVMEFMDGTTLRHILTTGRVTPEAALRYVPQICDALEYAHGRGVIHRDIKPENILIDKTGKLKIADFGLAKMVAPQGMDSQMVTAVDRVMGTPNYMAPEQMHPSGAVDHRADLYSLGVVFYEMLTGELPLGRFALPSQRTQVDVHLDDVVIKALEQNPELRYQHASQIKQEISGETSMVSATRQPTLEPLVRTDSPDFSRLAWIAVLCLPWGLPILWEVYRSGYELTAASPTAFHQSDIYRFFLMPFGLMVSVIGTILGWVSLQRSKGGASRRWLAWAAALAYPVIVFLMLGRLLPRVFALHISISPPLFLIGIVLIGIILLALAKKIIAAIGHKPKHLFVGGVICTIFLLIGGERLIRFSAEMREAYTGYLALVEAFDRTRSAIVLGRSNMMRSDMGFGQQSVGTRNLGVNVSNRLSRLEHNHFGADYLGRLEDQFKGLFLCSTREVTVSDGVRKGTLLIWVNPGCHAVSCMMLSGRSSYGADVVSAPDQIQILDVAIEGDAFVVGYHFPSLYESGVPDDQQFGDAKVQRERFEQSRDLFKMEINLPYQVRIPIDSVFSESYDGTQFWERGVPRN